MRCLTNFSLLKSWCHYDALLCCFGESTLQLGNAESKMRADLQKVVHLRAWDLVWFSTPNQNCEAPFPKFVMCNGSQRDFEGVMRYQISVWRMQSVECITVLHVKAMIKLITICFLPNNNKPFLARDGPGNKRLKLLVKLDFRQPTKINLKFFAQFNSVQRKDSITHGHADSYEVAVLAEKKICKLIAQWYSLCIRILW